MTSGKPFGNTILLFTLILSLAIGILVGGGPQFLARQVAALNGPPEPPRTARPPTATSTATASSVPTEFPDPTPTLSPTLTPPPTAPPTETPTAPPTEALTTPIPTSTATATPLLLTVVTQTNLVLRAGPGLDAPRITSLTPGTQALVVARNAAGDWAEIEVVSSLQRGWVYAAPSHVRLSGDLSSVPLAPGSE